MDGDHPISHAQAIELQLEIQQAGSLPMWTITHGTADYGELWVARPQAIHKQLVPFPFVLLGKTLEAVRASLPPGLTRMIRQPGDDPVIVEVWL